MAAPPGFYMREGLNAETYDTGSELPQADVDFFLDMALQSGGPVLDLGCGTGRVAWPLGDAGLEVVGLDRSEPMLHRAEAKRSAHPDAGAVRFALANMEKFQIPETCGLALSAFRAFQALLTPEAQRSCLECVRGALRPGGRLVLTLFDPLLDRCTPDAGPGSISRGARRTPTGHPVEVRVVARSNDPVRQILEEIWCFSERDADGHVLREEEERLQMRWTYRYEMRYLLELSGFEVEGEFSDFQRSPRAYGREQIWIASRR